MTAPIAPTVEAPPDAAVGSVGQQVRWLLAGLSAAAAGIHFAFAPGHFDEEWSHGLFFLVLGWAQLLWAGLLLTRPRRWLLGVGALANAAVIGVWALSRTAGIPDALGGGAAESVSAPDVIATILEGAIVLGSAALLASPALAARPLRAPVLARGLTMGVVAVALVGASVSLTPRYASDHHGGGAAAEAGGQDATAGGHHGAKAAPNAAAGGHHDASATPTGKATKGTTAGAGHAPAIAPYQGDSPCEQATKGRDEDGTKAEPAAEQGHDEHGPLLQKPITKADQLKLIEEQKLARAVVDKYPTAADALADGYKLSTVYLPCIGAHYTKTSLVVGFNPSTPSELLYDGSKPDAKIVGLSYLLLHPGGAPEGFAGPNDVWHGHSSNGGLCLNPQAVVIGGEKMSKEDCEKRGGKKAALKDIWMLHDWIVPGWECSWGVFASECPELGGRVGGTVWDTPAKE